MISAKQIQNAYVDLYEKLREYIWPAHVVSKIADLEISVYRAFPDLIEIKNNFNSLRGSCLSYIKDDELMNESFENFDELVDVSDTLYARLDTRLEGVEQVENF